MTAIRLLILSILFILSKRITSRGGDFVHGPARSGAFVEWPLVTLLGDCHKAHPMHGSLLISVAIFEDLPRILEETRTIFDSTPGFRCVHAGLSIQDAVKHVVHTNPDVVILDVQFQEGSGLSALAEIRRERPNQPVVMHTVVDSGDEIVLAYLLGASGYILKGDGRTSILDAVRIVADGGAIFSPRIAWAFRQMSLGAGPVDWILDLTPAEMEVLDLLAQGLTAKEIASRRDTAVGTINKQCEAIRIKAASRSIRHVVTQVGPWSRILRLLGGLWGTGGRRPSGAG